MDDNDRTISKDGTTLIERREDAVDLRVPIRQRVLLEILDGPDKGKTYEFPKGRVTVGRSGADFCLTDKNVSRKHFCIETWSRDQVYIRDLASTNGTHLNGVKISSTKLKSGDTIQAGGTRLRFIVENIK